MKNLAEQNIFDAFGRLTGNLSVWRSYRLFFRNSDIGEIFHSSGELVNNPGYQVAGARSEKRLPPASGPANAGAAANPIRSPRPGQPCADKRFRPYSNVLTRSMLVVPAPPTGWPAVMMMRSPRETMPLARAIWAEVSMRSSASSGGGTIMGTQPQ